MSAIPELSAANAEKLAALTSALEKINNTVGATSTETKLATVKQLLPNVGAALVTLGVVNAGTWGAVAALLGAVLSFAGWGWSFWDDRRTAKAVQAAKEDVAAANKVAEINAAVDAAVAAALASKEKEAGNS
ncbi:MAG: hypothetical protein LBT00_13285 [Spirochaetaceae bacterium]|jgi:hypothetical protein|nr:hypothetical protein [Spirochaetaceae bacterium]